MAVVMRHGKKSSRQLHYTPQLEGQQRHAGHPLAVTARQGLVDGVKASCLMQGNASKQGCLWLVHNLCKHSMDITLIDVP
jgi:hypothetical protein